MAKDFQSQTVVDGYDQHIRKLIPGYELVHLQIQAILKTHLPEHAHVLIVGCGTGYELSYLLAQHPTWSFTAVDPSLTMIEKAQQLLNATHSDLARVHFVHGDTTALQESAQFDAALAILVAHFIPLEAKPFFFADILRCLKNQAILLSYDLMRSSDDTELKVLQTLCQSNGLTVVQSEKMIERLQQDFYLVSASQMRELLTKVGFHEVRTYSQLLNYYGFFCTKVKTNSSEKIHFKDKNEGIHMAAYYQLLNREQHSDGSCTASYLSNIHAQGAWNPHEQHMAPATGVLCAELEQFQPRDEMRIGRVSLDIFGLIAFGEFTVHTRVIRAGKTIELIEAEMQANGKTCIVARAWKMMKQDTSAIAGLEDQSIVDPETLPVWDGMKCWPGGYIQSIETRAAEGHRAGKGIVWLHNDLDMVEAQETSSFVRLLGMVDTANGIVPRQNPASGWGFPNLDLQLHLYRLPQGKWLGLEATQQYGDDGIGLTSAVLHDEQGPFGRSEQILTLRKF